MSGNNFMWVGFKLCGATKYTQILRVGVVDWLDVEF